MMDWTQNKPNARFWVLKLIKDSFHPGDKLVETSIDSGDVAAQAFVTPAGRKLLLANKRNRTVESRTSRCGQGHCAHSGFADRRWSRAPGNVLRRDNRIGTVCRNRRELVSAAERM